MIVGDYYINNVLVLLVALALAGGLYYTFDVSEPLNDDGFDNSTAEYNIVLENNSLRSQTSQDLKVVKNSGEPVKGLEVMVNGNEEGTTGADGKLSFEVPDTETLNISVNTGESRVSRTFELSSGSGGNEEVAGGENQVEGGDDSTGSEEDRTYLIEKLNPEDTDLSSREFDLMLNLSSEEKASYRVTFSGEDVASGEFTGSKKVSESLEASEGDNRVYVELIVGGELKASETYSLSLSGGESSDEDSVQDEPSSFEISVRDPGNETRFSDRNVTVDFISSARNMQEIDYNLIVDGAVKASGSLENEGYGEYTEHILLDSGEHTFYVKAVNSSGSGEVKSTDNYILSVESEESVKLSEPEFDSYYTNSISLKSEIQAGSADRFRFLVDGNERFSETVSSDKIIEREISLEDGKHLLRVELLEDGETVSSDDKEINVSSTSVFELLHPDQEAIDDYETYFSFEINNSALEASSYDILVDGETRYSDTISGSGKVRVGQNQDLEIVIPDSGDHNWSVRTEGEYVNVSDPVSFSTQKSEPDDIQIDILNPEKDASVSGEVSFEWMVEAPRDTGYDVYWSSNESLQQGPVPFSGEGGSTEFSHIYTYNDSGTYSWNLEVQNSSTNEVIASNQRVLSYQK